MTVIKTKIQEKEKAFAEAMSTQNLEAALALYADDAVRMRLSCRKPQ